MIAHAGTTLDTFLDCCVSTRGLKPNTVKNYQATRRLLLAFFGPDRPLYQITAGDARAWHNYQVERGLAVATIARETKRARQFFRAAVDQGLLSTNPFAEVKAARAASKSSFDFFVSRETTAAILENCPTAEWALLVGLARFQAFRIPCEGLALTWTGVDWEKNLLTIRSPALEHHPDGPVRKLPLFQEMRPHLQLAMAEATPGAEYVVMHYRAADVNLRTGLARILAKAGIRPWGRLWETLRHSRQVELLEEFPAAAVRKWTGTSAPAVRGGAAGDDASSSAAPAAGSLGTPARPSRGANGRGEHGEIKGRIAALADQSRQIDREIELLRRRGKVRHRRKSRLPRRVARAAAAPLTPSAELSPGMTLSEFFRGYFLPCYAKPKRIDDKTVLEYRTAVDRWARLTGDPPLAEIHAAVCARFVDLDLSCRGRQGETLSPNTVRKHCTHLQMVLDVAGPQTRERPEAATEEGLFGLTPRGIPRRVPWFVKP
ncbi:MAG: tyrosine-type recombinase/integrase, partial [Pirellulales bacterium]